MLEQPILAPVLPVYRDKWIQIIGIPLITIFSYYLTYNNVRLNWWLAYEFCSDVLKIFLVWQVLRLVIIRLDKYYPWERNLTRRLAIQLPLTCVAGLLALTILVFTEYALIRPYPLEHYFSLDLIIALIFLLLVNAIYVSLYYYDVYLRSITEKQALTRQLQEEAKIANEHIIVKMGKRDIIVPFADILCLYSEEKETFVLTHDNKTYLIDLSLDKLEVQLPASLFFRANRKFIIAATIVNSIQAETYGKLLVHLKAHPKLPASLTISRDKAPAFRQWMKR